MITRRSLLRSLPVLAVGAPILTTACGPLGTGTVSGPGGPVAGPTGQPAPTVTGLPLTVTNQTGAFANNTITAYIVGTNLTTGQQSYVKPDGTLAPVALSDNGSAGYSSYGIPLAGSGTTTVGLPKMSGRIYFSINQPLKFTVVADGNGRPALQYPAGWVASDPSYTVLHDWIEFTYNDAGLFCNTTMVDMFSIPLAITLTGANRQSTGQLVTGGRDRIFAGIAADGTFAPLTVGDRLRVIAPGHGIESGIFPPTYFDPYVNDVWNRYQSTSLSVDTGGGVATGRIGADGTLAFARNGAALAPIAKPSTKDVLFCAGALAAPNDGVTGPVAAVLGAAFNRSTLRDVANQPTTDPDGFYQPTVTNVYSKVMHANTVDGRAYGFAFDDVAGQAAYVQDTAPTALGVTLTAF